MLSEVTLGLYKDLASRSMRFGDVGTVRIGTVTGANNFFTLRPTELEEAGIPSAYAQPILTRATQAHASVFTRADMQTLLQQDAKVLLFRPPRGETLHSQAVKYIQNGASSGLQNRYKCSKREPWYVVPVTRRPDAFLLYMSSASPRLILNRARAHCTNAIHAVHWHQDTGVTPSNAALASLTTLTQLGAELEGRSYGDGVLKVEPSAAKRLPLPVGMTGRFVRELAQADSLLRSGKADEATRLADRALLSRVVQAPDLDLLQDAVSELRSRRIMRGRSRPVSG